LGFGIWDLGFGIWDLGYRTNSDGKLRLFPGSDYARRRWPEFLAAVVFRSLATLFFSRKETAMKNRFSSAVFTVSTLIALGAVPGLAAADDYAQGGSQTMGGQAADDQMMGSHSMSGKIMAINHQTGWMKVKTQEGELRVHYPPKTVKELKKGEKIAVHLSYSKEGNDKMMKKE
jgi:hypothetical protein